MTAALALASAPVIAAPVGTAFTYQGRLTDAGQPANGAYDLRFALYDAASGGAPVGSPVTIDDVTVSQGLFTVSLDFGAGAFRGDARWLEVAARAGASTGAYSTVGGRQELKPAPNAQFASAAADVPWTGVSGKPAGFADNVDNDSGGTVTSVGTGAGLTGGPVTGSGTVSVATGGIVSAMVANGAITSPKIANGAVGADQINQAQVQTRIGGTCPLGSYLRGINPDGTVVCTGIPNPHTHTNAHSSPTYNVGAHTSIAVPPDGRPVIAYQNRTLGRLTFMRCGNAACSSGNLFRELDSTPGNEVGLYTSIAIGSDGFPVIAYHNLTAGTLKVAKCANLDCAGGIVVTTVDDHPVDTVGADTSIAIGGDGLPVISYYDSTAGGLKVAKCVNVNCTGLNLITMVHNPPNDVGRNTAIAVGSDGLPVIAYRDAVAGNLNVAKCLSAACNTGATITAVAVGAAGGRLDLALGADGLPVISYERTESQNSEIRVVKCGNAACNAGNTNHPVYYAFGLGGADSSIAIGADGLPVISHWGPALRVSKCGDAACGSGNVLSVLDSPADASVGFFNSIAVGPDGLPVVSHYDATNQALKISKCGNIACN